MEIVNNKLKMIPGELQYFTRIKVRKSQNLSIRKNLTNSRLKTSIKTLFGLFFIQKMSISKNLIFRKILTQIEISELQKLISPFSYSKYPFNLVLTEAETQ